MATVDRKRAAKPIGLMVAVHRVRLLFAIYDTTLLL